MLKVTNVDIFGWDAAIRGMRKAMKSEDRSDSYWTHIENPKTLATAPYQFFLGDNDHDLMMRLVEAGPDHAKFMRMIHVQMDVTAPLYLWKEFDTYKVGTVAGSESTMHTIHKEAFKLDDFSCEHLVDDGTDDSPVDIMEHVCRSLNYYRGMFIRAKKPERKKKYWWQMIQLLPSSFNQCRTIDLNYAVLRNIYHARKNHKLDEWHTFCEWIENLPYSEIITGGIDKVTLFADDKKVEEV